MSVYDLIKNIEHNKDFGMLLKKGVLPISVVVKKVYYEYYKMELSRKISIADAISNTSIEYRVSTMTVRRAIKFMES